MATLGLDLSVQDVQVVEAAISNGGMCTSNPNCVPTERSVLDHFGLAAAPDGRMAVTYVAQPPLQGYQKSIRVALSA